MKKIILALCLVHLPACTLWSGLDDPEIHVAPKLSLLRMTGDTRMQSSPPLTTNSPSGVEQLGAGSRDEEAALNISYGDQFAGFDFDYLNLDMDSTSAGVTQDDWGSIPAGASVNTQVLMDELRLRYVAGLIEVMNEEEDRWFRLGLGVQLAHKEMNFSLTEVGTSNGQKIEIKDDITTFLLLRLGVGRGPLSLLIDYAYNDDWGFGTGDLETTMFDLTAKASYYFEDQDLTIYAGYRRFDIPASGSEGALRYDTDFTLDGLFLGLQFVF